MNKTLTLVAIFASATGCSVSPIHSTRQTIGSQGGQIVVDQADDPVLAGTQLVIPPGAVPDGTVIVIERGAEQQKDVELALSPSVLIGPAGLTLTKPGTLFVPYGAQPSDSQVSVRSLVGAASTESPALLVSSTAGLAQFQVRSLGDFEVVATVCDDPIEDIDFARPAYDLSRPNDLAYPSQDLGQNDLSPGPDHGDFGYTTGEDDGGSRDLAPSNDGYVAPLGCGQSPQPDLTSYRIDFAAQ